MSLSFSELQVKMQSEHGKIGRGSLFQEIFILIQVSIR